jgi:hypothetical protein
MRKLTPGRTSAWVPEPWLGEATMASYLRARRSFLVFEDGILDACRDVLSPRRPRIEQALGCEIDFEETLARREDIGARVDGPSAAWIALKSPAGRWGGFYAGFYWVEADRGDEVRSFSSLYFNSNDDFARACDFFAGAIRAGEFDLYRMYGDYEIDHHRPLTRETMRDSRAALTATVERWLHLVEDANLMHGRAFTG